VLDSILTIFIEYIAMGDVLHINFIQFAGNSSSDVMGEAQTYIVL